MAGDGVTDIIKEAENRYTFDAEFNALVNQTMFVVAESKRELTGQQMDANERGGARMAAAVALIIKEKADA